MKFSLKHHLKHAELSPEERRQVLEDLFVFGKTNRRPFLIRMSVLMVLSTVIATAGLLSDSAAVVIGAMLVAPMMTPVMGTAGAVVMGWSGRFYRSIWLVLLMGVGAVLLSMAITIVSPEIVFLPEQVLARTRPTFYDLLIALAAGSAGAYTITHKESGAIPGVAVAVALLPPLASAGVLLIALQPELALRAVVLFVTNFVAMVLAGALTFMACGVSPASARRRSAGFIKSKLWLFTLLVAMICIPLYFYSQKVIFNIHYQAAQSDALQAWLRENDLVMTDIEVLKDRRVVYLALEGPDPPVSIHRLYETLSREAGVDAEEQTWRLEYSWTQKVRGSWPFQSEAIESVAEDDARQELNLLSSRWKWEFTQYDADRGSRPPEGDDYILDFEDKGKFEVTANCGTRRGKFTIRGKTLDMEMNRLKWFSCGKDDNLDVFLGDLQRVSEFYIIDGQLRIMMNTGSGIIHFRER